MTLTDLLSALTGLAIVALFALLFALVEPTSEYQDARHVVEGQP